MPVDISISTFKVIKAAKNLYPSPTIIMLLITLVKFLMLSSRITGAMFSPPAVIISSLILPVMYTNPSLSTLPVSPEWK
jgi:hypothetical protein